MTVLDALNLAAPLADTYESVEQRLLVAIARQLSLNDNHTLNEVSKWQIKQLARHGMLGKNAARIIAAGTKGIPGDVAAAVEQAIESTLAEDGLTEMWKNGGFSEGAKQAVEHYRKQARDVYNQVNTVMKYKAESTFVNAVNSVADKWTAEMRRQQAEIADKQSFLNVLNSNTAAVVSGSAARTKAVRTTIHEMAQRGIPAFVDKAGREWSPEAYVNMDIRNTVKNTALDTQFSVMDSLGQDVFEVSSHAGARPKCRPWQGKLISRSGKTTEITDLHGRKHKVIPLSQTSFGEPDGLFGINCGHRPRGCTEGVFTKSEVEYNDEEDKELYNKVCKQRELERRVRNSKTEADMLEAAGDSEGAKEVRRKMAEQNKALRKYCEENGLKYRSDRVRTYGAVKPKKALDKSAGSAIISVGSGRVTISSIDSPIEQRHTGKGNPNAILTFDVTLNNRQQELLNALPSFDSRVVVPRAGVNMADLSALTAKTGDEFALFTKGGERLVIRGNVSSVKISVIDAMKLAANGYRWSGHTHPGIDMSCLQASGGDYAILDCFNQKTSVIYNSKGQFLTFEKE